MSTRERCSRTRLSWIPSRSPGEVVLELRTAALNRRDLLVRKGIYPFPLALVPGSDGAGARRDTGEDVVIYPGLAWADAKTLRRRTSRFWADGNGTYAELIAVPEENVFPKPSGFS